MRKQEWTVPAQANQAPDIRIVQIDVLRGLAVLGIYLVNVISFGLPYGAYPFPTLLGEAQQANIAFWAFSEVAVEGTMRGLFSMLFGASAMIFLSEAKLASSGLELVDRYYRRTLLLMLFGILHAYFLLWPYDVLYAYGLFGLFLFPLRKLKPATLLLIGCLILVVGDIEIYRTSPDTNADISSDILDAAETLEHQAPDSQEPEVVAPDPAREAALARDKEWFRETVLVEMEDDIALHRAGYNRIFTGQIPDVIDQHSTYIYNHHIFDIGGMMLIGMALFKLGILSGKRSLVFYLVMAVAGYLIGGMARVHSVYTELVHGFDLTGLETSGGIDYDFGRLPVTLGHIGVIGLLCHFSRFDRLTRLLAAVGRLALTNYIMQTVISIFLFFGFGFSLFGVLERYELLYVCLGVWAFQIVFSVAWLKYYKYGPLEWLWRTLIYGQPQPFVR